MRPVILFPEQVTSEDGQTPVVSLETIERGPIALTLGITRILEDESLEVVVSGSDDGESWRVLAAFPQKCYCGTYSLLVDLSRHKAVRFLKAHWKMRRWGRASRNPLFGFYLKLEQPKFQVAAG